MMEVPRCGSYVLEEQLNEGGTADIFVASSAENQQVIIRRLRSQYQWNMFKRLEFRRGLKIQAQMHHPNVVHLIQLSTFERLPYAAMEFVEGMNLRQVLLRKDPVLNKPIT